MTTIQDDDISWWEYQCIVLAPRSVNLNPIFPVPKSARRITSLQSAGDETENVLSCVLLSAHGAEFSGIDQFRDIMIENEYGNSYVVLEIVFDTLSLGVLAEISDIFQGISMNLRSLPEDAVVIQFVLKWNKLADPVY